MTGLSEVPAASVTDSPPVAPSEGPHVAARRRPVPRTVAIPVVLGVLAAIWAATLTPHGILRLSPDSAAYGGAAQNIADGRGVRLPFVPIATNDRPLREAAYDGRAPLYQYSPGWPIILSAPIAAGVSMRTAAKTLEVLCFGLIAAIVAWLTMRLTRGSWIAAVVAAFLLVTTGTYVEVFIAVSSEAPFIAVTLVALVVLVAFLRRPTLATGITFAVLAAVSALTRFTGTATIATGFFAILLWYPGPLRARLRWALGVGIGASVPVLYWMSRDALNGPGGAGQVSYHPPPHMIGRFAQHFSEFVDGHARLSWPDLAEYLLFVALAAVVVWVATFLIRSSRTGAVADAGKPRTGSEKASGDNRRLVQVLIVFAPVYILILLASMTFLHGAPFNARYLLPVLPITFVFLATAGWAATQVRPRPVPRAALLGVASALAVMVVAGHTSAGIHAWRNRNLSEGLDATARGPAYRALRALPSRDIVFTHIPSVVYFASGHYSIGLPARRSIWTEQMNKRYERDVADIGRALCRHRGVVFLPPLRFATSLHDIQKRAGLQIVGTYPDGTILRVDPARCR